MLILGIFVGDHLPFTTQSAWWTASLSWFVATAVFALVAAIVRGRPILISCLLLLAVFCLGGSLISMRESRLARVFPANEVCYEAILVSEPSVHGKTVMAEMIVMGQGKPFLARATILRDSLTRRYEQLHVGSGMAACSRFEQPELPAANSHFDYQRWLHVRGVVSTTFISDEDWDPARVSNASLSRLWRVRLRLLKFRQQAVSSLRDAGLGGQEYAVVAAMAFGDKSAIAKNTRETYSVSGASHVLALSGLHLSIIYMLLTFIFVRLRWLRTGLFFTIPAIWLFSLMVGLSPSVTRAATMLTVCAFVALLGRKLISLNTLSLAAIIMLVANPLALWDVGFQLSFTAVLGILLFHDTLMNWLGNPKQIVLAWLVETVAVSLSAQILTAPLVAFYFGRFPTYFLITNLIAIPIVTIILYVAAFYFLMIGCGVLFGVSLSVLQSIVVQILERLSFMLNFSLDHIASWPCSSIEEISLNKLQVVIIYVLIAVVAALYILLKKYWKQQPHDE